MIVQTLPIEDKGRSMAGLMDLTFISPARAQSNLQSLGVAAVVAEKAQEDTRIEKTISSRKRLGTRVSSAIGKTTSLDDENTAAVYRAHGLYEKAAPAYEQ